MKQEQLSSIEIGHLLILQQKAIALLKQLIAAPSFSKEENSTAGIIENFFLSHDIKFQRHLNNVWAINKYFDKSKPTLLLNSHHDTVKPNSGYSLDPFFPLEKDGKLFGLGSNDAGGCLVSLIVTFSYFYHRDNLRYNIVLAASAEEEISGPGGIESLLQQETFKAHFTRQNSDSIREQHDFGIVGEPTQMQLAVAEKGLLVLDCTAHGIAGHAARNEGENAIYKAIQDIEWIRTAWFEKVSDLLGPVKLSVTCIESQNKAHNVVPASCSFVVDIRVNELYTFEEIIDIIKSNTSSELKPRSTRLRSSSIALNHPIVKAGLMLGKSCYGSPTTSDKALLNFPALKIGPGNSARSHSADEFIFVDEIREGIDLYIQLLEKVIL